MNSSPPVAGAEAGGGLEDEPAEDSKANSEVEAAGASVIGTDSCEVGVVPWLGSAGRRVRVTLRGLRRTGRGVATGVAVARTSVVRADAESRAGRRRGAEACFECGRGAGG